MLSFLELLKTTVTIFKLYKSPCSLHQCFKPWPVFAWLYEKVVCFLNGWKYCVLFWKKWNFQNNIKILPVFVSVVENLTGIFFGVQNPASIYIRNWKPLWYLNEFINCKYRKFWWLLSLGGDIFWMLEQIWFDWYEIVWGKKSLQHFDCFCN